MQYPGYSRYEGYLSHEMQLLSVLTHEQGLRLLEDPEEVLGEKHQHIVKSRTELATSRREVQMGMKSWPSILAGR